VRRRPGMYIGGTDANAFHHLAAEILDNSMDEAVANHASTITLELQPGNVLIVRDNGRGIPIDPHPKFKNKSALEVIMTTLHAGGKFDGKAYDTSGGLHGVGASVVNALSEWMEVEVSRDKHAWKMRFERGHAIGKLKDMGPVNRRGTITSFKPDVKIFGDIEFSPARLYRMAKSKAYLFRGVEIRWSCDPSLIQDETPAEDVLKFPGGLLDFLRGEVGKAATVTPREFFGKTENKDGRGAVEWAVTWAPSRDPIMRSFATPFPPPWAAPMNRACAMP
jgi:topoisomerase-4 subunit B